MALEAGLQKLHITRVSATDKKKDGTQIVNKYGKVTYKVGIQCEEQEGWLNGFLPFNPDKWQGTVQEVLIYEDPKWGIQFKLPPKNPAGGSSMTSEQWQLLNRKLDAIHGEIQRILGRIPDPNANKTSDGSPMPDFGEQDW